LSKILILLLFHLFHLASDLGELLIVKVSKHVSELGKLMLIRILVVIFGLYKVSVAFVDLTEHLLDSGLLILIKRFEGVGELSQEFSARGLLFLRTNLGHLHTTLAAAAHLHAHRLHSSHLLHGVDLSSVNCAKSV
jgi:hypothetical protein